jgi:GxxExxY protein
MEYLHEELTKNIIACFYDVYNQLGFGFLEKVYEHAMMIELARHGLDACNQQPIKVTYREQSVGDYYADIVVNGVIILE